jgi:hypothetical protein
MEGRIQLATHSVLFFGITVQQAVIPPPSDPLHPTPLPPAPPTAPANNAEETAAEVLAGPVRPTTGAIQIDASLSAPTTTATAT